MIYSSVTYVLSRILRMTKNDYLNGLAFLYFHPEAKVDIDTVVMEFMNIKIDA